MSWAKHYIGIPFLNKGRSLAGCDCWGLCREVFKQELNIELPDLGFAYEHANDRENVAYLMKRREAELVQVDTPQDFDFVFMSFSQSVEPHHVGLYVGSRRVLHVPQNGTSICPRYDRLLFPYYVEGFYRHPLLAERAA